MNAKIFISHSGEDRQWVRDFAAALRSQGSEVWLDEWQLSPGEPIQERLEKGLRESDIVAFIVTPENVHRGNFLFELGAAIGMGKRAVPIVAEDMRTSDLPFPLRARFALLKESPHETAKKLLAETQPESASR
ncbi:MAG TPA: toll/interleukin-1 receptor domain-containing protein [Pirellulales bacterium]|nr:toll/interleukin-1 receptor domain-containing protein [Pirellulales bacterium]